MTGGKQLDSLKDMDENVLPTPQVAPQAPALQPDYSNTKLPSSSSGVLKKAGIGLIALVLLGGLGAGVYLSGQRQDIQQHASVSSPACITYNQKDKCASSPDAGTKTGTTFIVDKCGTSTVTYSCFDPEKGTYYTQKDSCASGPLGPTDSSKKGHTMLLRKVSVNGSTIYSCVADCTMYPNTPHCPAISPTGDVSPTQTPQEKVGDVNNDGTIDILDYNILISCYGEHADTADCSNKAAADLNNDGVVDGIDYNIFLRALIGEQ